jgi:hypothetical protein
MQYRVLLQSSGGNGDVRSQVQLVQVDEEHTLYVVTCPTSSLFTRIREMLRYVFFRDSIVLNSYPLSRQDVECLRENL